METPALSQDSPAWVTFVQIAFFISLALMVAGICFLPVSIWIRGYLGTGLFFTISSTLTLSKTLRDNHEARKIINRVNEVKTERLLKEFDLKP